MNNEATSDMNTWAAHSELSGHTERILQHMYTVTVSEKQRYLIAHSVIVHFLCTHLQYSGVYIDNIIDAALYLWNVS